jgi:hypothetical protein
MQSYSAKSRSGEAKSPARRPGFLIEEMLDDHAAREPRPRGV